MHGPTVERAASPARTCLHGLCWALLAVPPAAQCNTWQAANHLPGVNGTVQAMAMFDPDGAGPAQPLLVIGGTFAVAGGVAANHIAAWDPSTGAWSTLGSGMDGGVNALAVLQSGDLVAAGSFATAGGVPANRVARWNGTSWAPLGSGIAGNASVYALAVLANGDLVAGGSFTTAGGGGANHVARWDGSAWSPLGSGVSGLGSYAPWVAALAVLANGDLVAGGTFDTAGGIAANCIARWDGNSWSSLGSGLPSGGSGFGPSVAALCVLPNGNLVAGGVFAQSNVAQWNGSTWSLLGSLYSGGFLVADTVRSLMALPNGDVIAGGEFASHPKYRVARWDGSSWSGLAVGFNGTVLALTTLPNGSLVAGGSFRAIHLGARAHGIAQWVGSAWSPLIHGMSPSVGALARLANGDIVAGAGTSIQQYYGNAYELYPVARWNGTAWSLLGLMRDSSSTARVSALVELPNGDLVAGGRFTSVDAVAVNNFARWNGTTWSSFGSGINGEVMSLLLLPNGDLVAGGSFTTVGGVAANRIARWDGTAWSPLGSGLTTNYGHVAAMALLPNGEIVAGGQFSNAGATPVNNIARWDGSTWAPLGTGMDNAVRTLTGLPSGDLVAGGDFVTAGGAAVNYVARWDGASWAAFGTGLTRMVHAVAALPSGDLAASTIGTSMTSGLVARWDGSSWSTIADLGTLPSDWTVAVVLLALPDGQLLAGGNFLTIQGVDSPYLARFVDCAPAFHVFGRGCPGSLGVPGIQLVQPPQTGATFQALLTGLPLNAAMLTIGWSRTSFSGGPLPYDLSGFGLPGCSLRVSPDVVQFLTGAGSVTTWSLPIPTGTALLGVRFHGQSLAIDTLANAGGATVSDAAMVTIGL